MFVAAPAEHTPVGPQQTRVFGPCTHLRGTLHVRDWHPCLAVAVVPTAVQPVHPAQLALEPLPDLYLLCVHECAVGDVQLVVGVVTPAGHLASDVHCAAVVHARRHRHCEPLELRRHIYFLADLHPDAEQFTCHRDQTH